MTRRKRRWMSDQNAIRCEAINLTPTWAEAGQCLRTATTRVDGRHICGQHDRVLTRWGWLRFTGETPFGHEPWPLGY